MTSGGVSYPIAIGSQVVQPILDLLGMGVQSTMGSESSSRSPWNRKRGTGNIEEPGLGISPKRSKPSPSGNRFPGITDKIR